MENIEKLGALFSEMVENYNESGRTWKNIPLGKKAFALMKDELPLRVKGELTPYTRIVLLNNMIDCMPERDCARFLLGVRNYQKSMYKLINDKDLPEDMDIDGYEDDEAGYVRYFREDELESRIKKIQDYLDPNMSMEDWCKEYGVMLKFDPVERTQEWEDCIYDVEVECEKKLKGESRGMGFCFSYWSTKRAVLAKHGIDWCSPSTMNPRVRFD